ncbi:putative bifunctional diguanylate cyclase/phosphodiesterase [Roseomonas sp. GCM10028921]
MHRTLAAQMAKATDLNGELELAKLGHLVSASYEEAERDRRRSERAMRLMAEEVETANLKLREVIATLQVQNTRFEAALENMSLGIAMYDANEQLVVANARLCEVLCVPPNSIRIGMSYSEVVAVCVGAQHFGGASHSDVYDSRRRIFVPGSSYQFEEPRGDNIVAVTTRALDGGGCIQTFEDMTERRRAEARIEHMAQHDALTGLANRTRLGVRLEESLARASRGESFAVLCLDLDRFKVVNDTLGHPVGDDLLRAVTARLCANIRAQDTAVRLGGDEFAIVQASIDQPLEATTLARRLIDELTKPYEIQGHTIVIGVSIGIAVGPQDGTSPDMLLKHADLALYRAKSEGRGTWRFFESEMDARMQARRRLEVDLRRALVNEEFELFFQPLVQIGSRSINSFEALLRWQHPERGMISPEEFIPLAEDTGLIVPLGAWVLHRACKEAAGWPPHVSIAVNVSAVQFRSPQLVDVVAAALEKSGLPGSRLEIEVTESIMLQDNVTTLAILHRLHGLGVRISMDDFGTGYSSLSYLRSFPFDKIKIDKCFIRDLEKKGDARAIVSAIAGLGRSLGMRTTAEGVETSEQFEQLFADGCTEAQGYLFGRPMPAEEAALLLLGESLVA